MLSPEQKARITKYIGPDEQKYLKPDAQVGRVLMARLKNMTPQQHQAIMAIVTPQSGEALKTLLPELSGMIDGFIGARANG